MSESIWENLEDNDRNDTSRMKVPGGWVVRVRHFSSDYNMFNVMLLFIKDVEYEWK